MIEIQPSSDVWNGILAGLPAPHLLQTREWGQVKSKYGWQPHGLVWKNPAGTTIAAALVLEKKVRVGGLSSDFSILYSPRGPLLEWCDEPLRGMVLEDLKAFSRQRKAIFLKIDPEIHLGSGVPGREDFTEDGQGLAIQAGLAASGWLYSPDQIQFRNTAWLNLDGTEEDWLARMHPKTRYNIRLAARKGVKVREAGEIDLALLYKMYAETSVRDGFVIRDRQYYLSLWKHFMERGMAVPFIAEVEGRPAAGLVLFHFLERAWYLFGMSRDMDREKMPNHLLQWEAMKTARALGCRLYDLWGAPDVFDGTDPMQGVFRFKDGLGARVIRTAGAWDYPTHPIFYRLYTVILPKILDMMRRRGKKSTLRQAGL